jgi:predicted AAA+ superfamily ATPase
MPKASNEEIRQMHNLLLGQLESSFTRPMAGKIAWHERLVGIMGARGAGKTTLILQHIMDTYGMETHALYATLDTLSFAPGDLYQLAESAWREGVEALFLDEVHKFETWSTELKKVYDFLPKLKVVFTGSSLLHIIQGNADLSRRAVTYHLDGLSFREYVQIQSGQSFAPVTLNNLLQNHVAIASDIVKKVKPFVHFQPYLQHGYYPYFLQGADTYSNKLMGTLIQILEFDIPYLRGVEIRYVNKLKQLLHILAQSVPYKPNVVQLADALGISRNVVLLYLHHLQDACILRLLYPSGALHSKLKKPEKVYLWHPNHMYLLGNEKPDTGNIRETFFYNQVGHVHEVFSAAIGDFSVDGKYTFEVGGKNKTDHQVRGEQNAYVALDDIEIGYDNRIPLWLFGWLY